MSAKTLTSGELRKLSRAAVDLYKATNQRALGAQVHTLIKSACTVEYVTYSSINRQSQSGLSLTFYSHPDAERRLEKAWPAYLHYVKSYPEIWSHVLSPRHQGKVMRVWDTLPASLVKSVAAVGYVDEVAKPNFGEFQLIYYIRNSGGFAGITCNRNGREFTDKEKAVLEFLSPHLQAAYENCAAFEANAGLIARAAAAQRVTSQEMIWLDQALAIVEITPRIPELIREFFNEEMGYRQLPQKITEWLRATGASPTHPPLRPLIIRRPNASLKIRFYPEQLPGLHLLTLHRQSITPTLDDLKPLGLSRRESEVLLWLAQGKTNAEISRLLYINRRTVDGHVQAILAKLGVENRTAASLLVADLLHG